MTSPTITDYDAAVGYLMGRINYEQAQAVPYAERTYKLGRMRDLLRRLDEPQNEFPIVHIAGTKGKGSTAEMLARILRAAGLRVGVYSSPHLERLEERFAVDGELCEPGELISLVSRLKTVVEQMDREYAERPAAEIGPTYFELTTALALDHFRERQVDVAILEVGMGGRLDSTNVCLPICCVITSISFDHTKQLGNTLAEIAAEKAGIIKPGVPVISAVLPPEPRDTIAAQASRIGAPLKQLGRDFQVHYERNRLTYTERNGDEWHQTEQVELGMAGVHQANNAAAALATASFLQAYWPISEQALRKGLRAARLPARIEVVRRRPTVILDAAHNAASMEALLAVLRDQFPQPRRTLLFAASRDKDYRRMLDLALPYFDRVVFTQYLDNPRAVPPGELLELATALAPGSFQTAETPRLAWQAIASELDPEELVCVTGSFFIAAELRHELLGDVS